MRKHGNINFVLVGAKATGKTVYLASIFLNLKNITSEDGHTIEYLKPLAEDLLSGNYPQATAGTLHELLFNYKDEKFSSHIQIDDVDGYFVETMHIEDKNTQKQRDLLIKNIKNSEGIIFFFPYEESFNEESIKNFNYEIDTVISKLIKMYEQHSHIPIPAVIAVSKWDKSPYFKAKNEEEKAIEYINNNRFLKLAKEKIENNFSNTIIVPISAIGEDINNIEPYNLDKPIRFFLDETYRLWESKIDTLKDNKDKLLQYLSKLHFDMKFYKSGKYIKLYDNIEKEIFEDIENSYKNCNIYDELIKIKDSNKNTINALKPEHIDTLNSIENSYLKKKRQNKDGKYFLQCLYY